MATWVREQAFVAAVKDACLAAFVALALAIPLFLLRTKDGPEGLGLTVHWREVALGVAAVFIGRLAIALFMRWHKRDVLGPRFKLPSVLSGQFGLWLPLAAIGFAVVLPAMPFANRYVVDLAILVLTYVMLGWGLNIVVGLAGLLDLGYVAFYAVGAYSYALLAQQFGLSFWICLPLAGILAAFWGIILGFPVLRLRGDYLAIVTLAFGEIIRIVLENWAEVTGGPNGV